MSMPEHRTTTAAPTPGATPRAEALVADIDRRLRRHHLTRADRRAITGDLLGDLRAAEADGRDPAVMIGSDLDGFVSRTLEEGGYVTARRNPLQAALLVTLAAVPVVVVAHAAVIEVLVPLFTAVVSVHADFPGTGVAGGWAGVWLLNVLVVLAVLAAVLRGHPAARVTFATAAVVVPLAGAVAVASNILIIYTTSQITAGSITAQVISVLLPLVGALAVAYHRGLRSMRQHGAEGAAPHPA